jgi:hypothetical protein
MTPNELIRQHERAICLLEMIAQEENRYRSHCENVACYKRNWMHSLSEKEAHRAANARLYINALTKRYKRLTEKFNN